MKELSLTEGCKSKLQRLAGIITEGTKEEIIIKKIGLPNFVADWAEELSDKYSIWIADSFKRLIIDSKKFPELRNMKGEDIEKKLASDEREPMFDDFLKKTMEEHSGEYKYILDWLKGRSHGAVIETDKLDFKNLTFTEALKRSEEWHKELSKVQGGQIKDETGDVVLTFPDGFYWIDLKKGEDADEGRAMSHCGRCQNSGEHIISLRKDGYPYISGCIHPKTHIISQLRGRANTKPKKSFHTYIMKMLTDPKLGIKFFQYDGYKDEENFRLEDLERNDLVNLIKTKPLLLKGQQFNRLNFSKNEIMWLIKNHPEVVPTKILLKNTDFEELQQQLLSPEHIKKLITLKSVKELLENLKDMGEKYSELAALAMYKNPAIKNMFYRTTEDDSIGGNVYHKVPIEMYIELLGNLGESGKKYLRDLIFKTGEIENVYLKNNALNSFILTLASNDVLKKDGINYAYKNFKKELSDLKSGLGSFPMTINLINSLSEKQTQSKA